MTTTPPTQTKIRHVRIPDQIWNPAAVKAREEDGITISELVRDLLRDYNGGRLKRR